MATLTTSRIVRAPGRLVCDPTDAFLTGTFPYGGTVLGIVSQYALAPLGSNLTIWYEGNGGPGDILEPSEEFAATCFLRGWDDDALMKVLGSSAVAAGSVSGHNVFSAPGNTPGKSALGRAHKFVFVPDNPIHAPACILYAAVPEWDQGARLHFGRTEELGMPVVFQCVRDSSDRILKVGRLVDLAL